MSSLKILLVDDEETIRAIIGRELRLENYQVYPAVDGREALSLIEEHNFDAVITDLVMPDIDGISVLKAAKKKSAQTSVLILTGYGDLRSAIDALRLGADDYIAKPCDTDELLHRLSSALEKKSLLDQLKEQNRLLEEVQLQLEQRVSERTAELEETNIALNVLLAKRERDKETLEQQIIANVAELIEPYLSKLEASQLTKAQEVYIHILKSNVNELTSSLSQNMAAKFTRLTPAEVQIANLVKLGKRTKEIAEILHLSPGTINIHRKNIRKKLGLTNKKVNLQTVLSSYS